MYVYTKAKEESNALVGKAMHGGFMRSEKMKGNGELPVHLKVGGWQQLLSALAVVALRASCALLGRWIKDRNLEGTSQRVHVLSKLMSKSDMLLKVPTTLIVTVPSPRLHLMQLQETICGL